jgi:phosphoribosylamine--glycine ligase
MNKALNILVIGSGGREHAIVKKCIESPLCNRVIAAPGNGGMAESVDCFPIAADSINELVTLAQNQSIDFVIVGPEVPLCLGIVDALQAVHIPAYGPTQEAAQLESSKSFCKDFFQRHNIPTAKYATFDEVPPALDYLDANPAPIVVKASGLAAGKGVIIAQTTEEAKEAVQSMLVDKSFGTSGSQIVIEEFLEGEEVSIHAIVSNGTFLCLSPSQDHKRIGENDTGLNTGGMGAYAPTAIMTDDLQKTINSTIIVPTIKGLEADGIPYNGTLYAGLMLTQKGPKILEYNVRFGDPETQVMFPLVEDDLIALLYASATNQILPESIKLSKDKCMTVVIASQGYPGNYPKGDLISFPSELPEKTDIIHAGTVLKEGKIYSNGGRVLSVTSQDETILKAREKIYSLCDSIDYQEKYYRKDIAHREIKRLSE